MHRLYLSATWPGDPGAYQQALLAFGSAAVFSAAMAVSSVEREFYDMFKNTGWWRQLRAEHLKLNDDIREEARVGKTTPAEMQAKLKQQGGKYTESFNTELGKVGFETSGSVWKLPERVYQRFNAIGPQKRVAIVLTYLASLSVALGGLLLLNVRNEVKHIKRDRENEEMRRKKWEDNVMETLPTRESVDAASGKWQEKVKAPHADEVAAETAVGAAR